MEPPFLDAPEINGKFRHQLTWSEMRAVVDSRFKTLHREVFRMIRRHPKREGRRSRIHDFKAFRLIKK
ncbi:hypothetical protein AAVH_39162, partial [Aphelenchoides avenae]